MIEIIGKNGSGKSYLANKLYNLGFKRNVGYTTRPIRDNEIDGLDYFFITQEKFLEYLINNEFIEYKIRNGFYYGILKNNISDNTILVSGDSKKIASSTGYNILKLYIDCDFAARYFRVLERKDTKRNIFNRFHTENFAYLSDFEAIFIDNSNNDNASLDKILNIINGNASTEIMPNREFIRNRVDNFEIASTTCFNDKLLMLLKYEEYLLRKLYLENNDLETSKAVKKYYEKLIAFLNNNAINYKILDHDLCVFIDDEAYEIKYLKKRKVI